MIGRETYVTVSGKLLRRTVKAVLIESEGVEAWLPLSCLGLGTDRAAENTALHEEVELEVAEWIARDKGLT